MAEKDETQNESNEDLRSKLEAAIALNKSLTTERDQLAQDNAIERSGIKLNDRQRNAVLRDLSESNTELTADSYKLAAQELGFNPTQTPPANEQQNGQQTPPPNPNGQPAPDNPDEIMVSLAEMSTIDRANYHAQRGHVHKDLTQKINETQNADELTSLIRKDGPASGLVHEWDTQ